MRLNTAYRFSQIINTTLYHVICLVESVPIRASWPVKFHPPESFCFPKRKLRIKAERSFRAEWCMWGRPYVWLHYDVSSDSAFCHLCMTAAYEGKLIASTKKDPAFFTKEFTYWKEATTAFKKHEASQCHKEAANELELSICFPSRWVI